LAQAIVQEDYGWFTPADLVQVVTAIHRLPKWETVVLVGGQSLTAWVKQYGIELPAFDGPYLTADADFLASRTDAQVIASHLNDGHARYPKADDHTQNAAVIDFKGEQGTLLHIDILGVVLGLKEKEIRKLAVPMDLEGVAPIAVLHPLLVLESRCINLEKLSGKRNANGITQAKVACLVVQRYVQECLGDPSRRRESLNAVRRVIDLARSSAGVYVFHKWGIDILSSFAPDKMPGKFLLSWPHDLEKINKKREIASRRSAPYS
jgi:hypothetical protein